MFLHKNLPHIMQEETLVCMKYGQHYTALEPIVVFKVSTGFNFG